MYKSIIFGSLMTLLFFGCKTEKKSLNSSSLKNSKQPESEIQSKKTPVDAQVVEELGKPEDLNEEKVILKTVSWLSFEEALELSKTEKKKIFIDVYTDWCGWCKVMDKNTFSHPEIARYLNENFYAVKLDGEQEEDIIFKDHTFKFVPSGRRGYHELAATLLNGKLSYPTVVFLDEDYNMIQPLPGYQKPNQFEKIVKFIGGDHFKTTKWVDFEREFQSAL